MKEILNVFKKPAVVIVLGLVVTLAVVGSIGYFLVLPQFSSLGDNQKKTAELTAKLADLTKNINTIKSIDQGETASYSKTLNSFFPENTDYLHFATLNDNLAADTGLKITNFTMSSATKISVPAATASGSTGGTPVAAKQPVASSPTASPTVGAGYSVVVAYSGSFDKIESLLKNLRKLDRELRKKLEFYQKEREDKSRKVVKNLNAIGYRLEFNEVKKLAKGTIAGPHIAFLVIGKKDNEGKLREEFGKIPETGEFIQKYLTVGGPAYEARVAATPKEAIDLIHQARGLAILAHPCWNLAEKDGKKLIFNDKVIEDLVKIGLDGIEVYAHRDNEADTKKCVEHFEKVAAKMKLAVSGGSDFHDFGSAGKDLGFTDFYLKIPYGILENLRKLVKTD